MYEWSLVVTRTSFRNESLFLGCRWTEVWDEELAHSLLASYTRDQIKFCQEGFLLRRPSTDDVFKLSKSFRETERRIHAAELIVSGNVYCCRRIHPAELLAEKHTAVNSNVDELVGLLPAPRHRDRNPRQE